MSDVLDSQSWVYKNGNMEKIERALLWAKQNPPEDDLKEWLEEVGVKE